MKTSPNQSLSKALGFGSMSVMTTGTTSLGDQMANLTRLINGISTSFKEKTMR
jgi:hypothetical protein